MVASCPCCEMISRFTSGPGAALAPDAHRKGPVGAIAQGRIFTPSGHLADRPPHAAQDRAYCAHRPRRVENDDGVRPLETEI
jgi:hypothetical protein